MSFKKTLAQRFFNMKNLTPPHNCRIVSPSSTVKSFISTADHDSISPNQGDDGIFRNFLNRGPGCKFPAIQERLKGMDIAKGRIILEEILPRAANEEEELLTVEDARKLLKLAQLEIVKSKLRANEKHCITYDEFVKLCSATTSFGDDEGIEMAKILDQSGSVIVLGNVVFIKPEQVMKTIKGLTTNHLPKQSYQNPRTKEELERMEIEKAEIDKRAESLARRELWCGLGYLMLQTSVFMRLTFWDLSWDVMEPICFYVTSMYFMAGYTFFLRTSKEPSFEGFFSSRISSKQKRLMKIRNFDLGRYNELRKIWN